MTPLLQQPDGGVAAIMADVFDVYDKTGPGISNYNP